MIYLLSIDEQIKNSLAIVKKFYEKSPESYEDLRALYIEFLKKRHPDVAALFSYGKIQFITDRVLAEPFLKKATKQDSSLVDDLNQGNIIDVGLSDVDSSQISLMSDALQSLKSSYTEFYNAVELVIPSVVFLGSTKAKGGSFSGLLGIIWCGIHKDWSIKDYEEFWIHEATHHFLFLDEIVHEHYDYEIFANKENWSQSAILNMRRPLDKVLHSIAVAIEVISYRLNILKTNSNFRTKPHPETSIIFKQIEGSLLSLDEALSKSPTMLKDRGYYLVNLYKYKYEVLKEQWLRNLEDSKEIA
ncbi:hypothetical protein KTJ34_15475 [Acinetobacter courvalinii]|uniref:aKG-HExxH-type peptide beta-hydroxylase n=1 Tax=Acinetobacter courvalinii TaxID=280147 RepID=UPI0021CEABFE|nr:HEXXH motif-containing putative peptide modification protein [Acinetobacter courvalinii]MCU4578823.1 hypothetical protein [Acinetobacter courvalinii]